MLQTVRLFPILVMLGCATTPVVPPAPPAPPAMAPTPYTAEQIRDATHVGRSYEFKREIPGVPTTLRTMTFVRVGPNDADIKTTVKDEAGAEVEAETTSTSTWEELRKHAEFPKAMLAVTEESVPVPAGIYDCMVYTLTDASKPEIEVTRFYFAKNMPGAPVFFSVEKNGKRFMTSSLVRYSAGN